MFRIKITPLVVAPLLIFTIGASAANGAGDKACANTTQGTLRSLQWDLCKARANLEHSEEGRRSSAKTDECLEALIPKAKKAVQELRACLVKRKKKEAVEALLDYYTYWQVTAKMLSDDDSRFESFSRRLDARSDALEEKHVKLDALIDLQ